ncbi:MAG: hypothetical protein R2706_18335 [Acidimicrobiales bacterium]
MPVYEDDFGVAYQLKRFLTIGALKSFGSTFRSMPLSIKLATVWLLAISSAPFASWLPLQDPVCQLNLPLPCANGMKAVKGRAVDPTLPRHRHTPVRDNAPRIVFGAQVWLGGDWCRWHRDDHRWYQRSPCRLVRGRPSRW